MLLKERLEIVTFQDFLEIHSDLTEEAYERYLKDINKHLIKYGHNDLQERFMSAIDGDRKDIFNLFSEILELEDDDGFGTEGMRL